MLFSCSAIGVICDIPLTPFFFPRSFSVLLTIHHRHSIIFYGPFCHVSKGNGGGATDGFFPIANAAR